MAQKSKTTPRAFWAILGLAILVALALSIGLLSEILSRTPDKIETVVDTAKPRIDVATPPPGAARATPREARTTDVTKSDSAGKSNLVSCVVESSGSLTPPDAKGPLRLMGFDVTKANPQIWLLNKETNTLEKFRFDAPENEKKVSLFSQNQINLACKTESVYGCLDTKKRDKNDLFDLRGHINGDQGIITAKVVTGKSDARSSMQLFADDAKSPLGAALGLCGEPLAKNSQYVSILNGTQFFDVAFLPDVGLLAYYPFVKDDRARFFARGIPRHAQTLYRLDGDSLTPTRCEGEPADGWLRFFDVEGDNIAMVRADRRGSKDHLSVRKTSGSSIGQPTFAMDEAALGGHVVEAGWLSGNHLFVETGNWLATRQKVRVFGRKPDGAGYGLQAVLDDLSGQHVLPSLTRSKDGPELPKLLAIPHPESWLEKFMSGKGQMVWLNGSKLSSVDVPGLDSYDYSPAWVPLSSTRFVYLGQRDEDSEPRYQIIRCTP